MRFYQPALILSALVALSACSSRPQPAPAPSARPQAAPVRPAPPAVAPATTNWQDQRATPGDWGWKSDARGSVALFGAAGQDAVFLIRCEREGRRIFLSRSGAFPAGETGRMSVRTSYSLQTYPVGNSNTSPPYISAQLATADPLLDAMIYSRGKFLVSVKGVDDLVVPAWAEVGRVIEDCR